MNDNIKQMLIPDDFLNWFNLCVNINNDSNYLHKESLGDLKRGDVVLVELGQNIGKEFSGQHPAVVLKDCSEKIEQVFILPLTSKKPKGYNPNKNGIYLEFRRIPGMKGYQHKTNLNHKDNYKHWANILNIRNISRNRILCPPKPCRMDGKDLKKISKTIENQLVI